MTVHIEKNENKIQMKWEEKTYLEFQVCLPFD